MTPCAELAEKLANATDDHEKCAIIDALTQKECTSVSPTLLRQLSRHNVYIQVSIAFCMRELANEEAKSMIFDILVREDLDEEVRGAFTEVVGHYDIQACLPIIISRLDHPLPTFVTGAARLWDG